MALFSEVWDHGNIPRNRKEAIESIKWALLDSGSDLGDISCVEEEWPLIAEMNDLPSFEEFKAFCLRLFPEVAPND